MPQQVGAQTRARWLGRTRAEHASAAVMASLAGRFEQVVPDRPGIAAAIRRAAEDERRHAALCEQVLARLGQPYDADQPGPTLPLTESGELRLALIEHVVFLLCAGEAIAARMLAAARDGATAPGIAELLDVIAKDEARHGALGWVVLDALLEGISEETRQVAASLVPRQAVRAVLAAGAVGDADQDCGPWGLLHPDEALAVAKAVMVERIGPELSARRLWSQPG